MKCPLTLCKRVYTGERRRRKRYSIRYYNQTAGSVMRGAAVVPLAACSESCCTLITSSFDAPCPRPRPLPRRPSPLPLLLPLPRERGDVGGESSVSTWSPSPFSASSLLSKMGDILTVSVATGCTLWDLPHSPTPFFPESHSLCWILSILRRAFCSRVRSTLSCTLRVLACLTRSTSCVFLKAASSAWTS